MTFRDGRSPDEPIVIGFDLGSSAAKIVVATESGSVLARGSAPQQVERRAPGLAEQRPGDWWAALCGLARQHVGAALEGRGGRVAAVAISGHFPTLAVATETGRAIGPAMLYADIRAEALVREASDLVGQPLLGDELAPKLLWLRHESPATFRRIERVFNPQDYLAFHLTGCHVLDHHTASRLGGLLDPDRLAWREDVMERLGLPVSVLPLLQGAGTPAGTVSTEAAAATGIPAGTPVVTGVGDTLAALLGAGVVRERQVLIYYGTTATADVCTQDVGAYLANPGLLAAGAPYREVAYALIGPALPWAAAGFEVRDPAPSLSVIDAAAGRLATSVEAPYVLPFFVERPPSGAVANRPAVVGLDVEHGRPHLHRALLESFGYVVRAGLEAAGFAAATMGGFTAAGGGAASGLWRQLVSDALGVEQRWSPDADGALGDAMLAAWGSGMEDTFEDGRLRWLGSGILTRPDPEAVRIHRVRYEIWNRLVGAVADAYRDPPDRE